MKASSRTHDARAPHQAHAGRHRRGYARGRATLAGVEEPLGGGGLTDVVRLGDTVRRATGPWTPAVHALLRHLESVGFDAAPRVLGTDDRGREILTYVRGVGPSWSDAELEATARLVRAYHDATESFVPPEDADWQVMVGAPQEGDVICHNDLSPWNTIYRDGEPVAIVDWDLAAPGPRLWDVAWAVYRYVPLFDDDTCRRLEIQIPAREQRLRLFCDCYGLDDRSALLTTVCARLDALIASAREWGEAGQPGWRDVWQTTRGAQWRTGRAYVESNAARWQLAL
jgi:Phosphotransferase enzyme family